MAGAVLAGTAPQAGITLCAGCHFDPEPLPESVRPIYYSTPETRVDDPCNQAPEYRENWSVGDTPGTATSTAMATWTWLIRPTCWRISEPTAPETSRQAVVQSCPRGTRHSGGAPAR